MANNIKLTNYTDFDRLLISGNLIVTILGMILAFSLSYFSVTILSLPVAPFGLSLSLAIVFAVSTYTRNIASSFLVAIFAAIGLVSPYGTRVQFIEGYILFCVLISLFLGRYADKYYLILKWTKSFLVIGFLSSIFILVLSVLSNDSADRYWNNKLDLRVGGDPYFGTNYPVLELIAGLLIFIIFILSYIHINRTLSLSTKSSKNFKLYGIFMLLVGLVINFVVIGLYSQYISRDQALAIADYDSHLITIDELISHQGDKQIYSIFSTPVNSFILIAFSVILISIGIAYFTIGKNSGNIDTMRPGGNAILLSAPISMFILMLLGTYYIQNYIYPNGFFFANELLPIYFSMMWSLLFLNMLVALILYKFFTILFKN